MELERDTASRFIEYLKEHGYPESSIAVEYQIEGQNRVDIAVLDLKNNIPIQLFEIKSRKSAETIRFGTEQLNKYISLLKNKNIPAYLVFPSQNHPFFDVIRINDVRNQTDDEINANQQVTLNYNAQRISRISEEAKIIKKKRECGRHIQNYMLDCGRSNARCWHI